MADPQQEVVIRDNNGTEHVFPAGFDPQKAAAIVSRATDERPPFDAEAEGMMDLGKHPGLNAAGAAVGFGPFLAAAAPVGAMLRGAGSAIVRAAESPVVGGISGGYEGYKRGGIPGAILGAAAGAGGSSLLGGARGFLKAATAAKEAETAAKLAKPIEMLPRVDEALIAAKASGTSGAQAIANQLKRDFLLRSLGNSRY